MGQATVRKMGYAKFGYTPPLGRVRKMGYLFLMYTHPKIPCQKNGIPFFDTHPPLNHMSEKWDIIFSWTPTPLSHVRKMGYLFLMYTHPFIACQKNGISFFTYNFKERVSEKWDTHLSEKWDMLNLGTPHPQRGVRKMGCLFLLYTHPKITCQKNGIPIFGLYPPQYHMSEKWDTYF